MIAEISEDVRDLLGTEAIEEIGQALQHGVICAVCESAIRPELEQRPSVLALQDSGGRVLVRFAHERCAGSRLVALDGPFASPPRPPLDAPRHRPQPAWALSARRQALPTIILACDVDQLADLEVRGASLLDALRLEGLKGGGPLAQLRPTLATSIRVTRERATLALDCDYGRHRLAIAPADQIRPLLHVAARQRELLLVLGQTLTLGAGDLQEAERRLRFGQAVAARVTYADPELAGIPLPQRRLRRAAAHLRQLAPSARASARSASR